MHEGFEDKPFKINRGKVEKPAAAAAAVRGGHERERGLLSLSC